MMARRHGTVAVGVVLALFPLEARACPPWCGTSADWKSECNKNACSLCEKCNQIGAKPCTPVSETDYIEERCLQWCAITEKKKDQCHQCACKDCAGCKELKLPEEVEEEDEDPDLICKPFKPYDTKRKQCTRSACFEAHAFEHCHFCRCQGCSFCDQFPPQELNKEFKLASPPPPPPKPPSPLPPLPPPPPPTVPIVPCASGRIIVQPDADGKQQWCSSKKEEASCNRAMVQGKGGLSPCTWFQETCRITKWAQPCPAPPPPPPPRPPPKKKKPPPPRPPPAVSPPPPPSEPTSPPAIHLVDAGPELDQGPSASPAAEDASITFDLEANAIPLAILFAGVAVFLTIIVALYNSRPHLGHQLASAIDDDDYDDDEEDDDEEDAVKSPSLRSHATDGAVHETNEDHMPEPETPEKDASGPATPPTETRVALAGME